jgi:hypothetical protein
LRPPHGRKPATLIPRPTVHLTARILIKELRDLVLISLQPALHRQFPFGCGSGLQFLRSGVLAALQLQPAFGFLLLWRVRAGVDGVAGEGQGQQAEAAEVVGFILGSPY